MAKAKKKKWKYKFLTEDKFEEYKALSKDGVIEALKKQAAYADEKEKAKRASSAIKTLAEEIKEYRDNYRDKDAIDEAKEKLDELKKKRDLEIISELDDKKHLEGAMSDEIKGAKEHVKALLFILRFHK